jgi:hypothetical protein
MPGHLYIDSSGSHVVVSDGKTVWIPALVLIDQQGIIADYQLGSGEIVDLSIRSALKKLGVKLP